jgi:glycosyltransferase involved in cell wall biosynthesis
MRVALDISWLPPRRAGAGRYAWELLGALAGEAGANHTFSVYAPRGTLDSHVARAAPNFAFPAAAAQGRIARNSWEQLALPVHLRKHRVDLLHVLHSQAPVAVVGTPIVATFHDVTYELMPERYGWPGRLYYGAAARIAAHKAKLIIAVSECVAADIRRTLAVPGKKIRVVHEAASAQFSPASGTAVSAVRKRYSLDKPYVLSVGTLEAGKNRELLAAAHARLVASRDVDLVVVGQRRNRAPQVDGVARYLGYVPDDDLPPLYTGAAVFAFPSLYEGFGLPLLEAMACGAPVVASNTGSIPEVAGDAAILVPPTDAEALAAALDSVLSNPGRRQELIARGSERAALFSWDKAARETVEVYEEAVAL